MNIPPLDTSARYKIANISQHKISNKNVNKPILQPKPNTQKNGYQNFINTLFEKETYWTRYEEFITD